MIGANSFRSLMNCLPEQTAKMIPFDVYKRQHVMAQAVKHLYPEAKFWVGPVVKEGFYYDIDLGENAVNDDVIAAIEKEMKKICKEGKKIYHFLPPCSASGCFFRTKKNPPYRPVPV